MSGHAMGGDKLQSLYDREGRNTSSNDPKMLDSRVFIGNLPSDKITRLDVEKLFTEFGTVLGVSLHKSYGFVQYDNVESARKAVESMHGNLLQGSTLDVNLAGDRRKEKKVDSEGDNDEKHRHGNRSDSDHRSHRTVSSRHHRDDHRHSLSHHRDRDHRRRGRTPSPPYLSRELEYRAHLRRLERMHGFPPSLRDPFFDPIGLPPRDPYLRPRDDPYDMRERYPPGPPLRMRDPYGPSLHDHFERRAPLPLPRERDPILDRPPLSATRSFTPPPIFERRERSLGSEKMTDMEIIVVNRQQKEYAELIRGRVEYIGLVVDMIQLSPTVSLADALDAAASRGLLYAVIVTSQHEIHRSVTLTILHGRNPQEHKNMPLDDALGLVDRDFTRYTMSVREGRIPPRRPVAPKNEVASLLGQAASGEQLTPSQLQQVIDALQKQKHVNEPQPTQLTPKEDIQRQQADLQAKILSLLGSNAVVPSSSSNQPSSQGHSYDNGGVRGGAGGSYSIGRGYGSGSGVEGGGRGYGQGDYGY